MRVAQWAVIVVAVTFAGCERGCLTSWLGDHGVGGAGPRGASDAGRLDLTGTDCSDGLARCVDRRIEVSRLAHLPSRCSGSPLPEPVKGGGCECPWESVGTCATSCVVDGVEVVADADAAAVQLCRPELPVARPYGAADPPLAGVCTEEGITCRDGVVRGCDAPGAPPRALGKCLEGCATTVAVVSSAGALGTSTGPAEILCRRDHAERR
jgi:hypothetical protein